MIDLHCHILPGVDDGSADEEESCAMARLAVESGVTDIAATPHCNAPDPFYNYADSALHARFARLRQRLERERIPLRIHEGMEVFTTTELPRLLDEGRLLTVGAQGAQALLSLLYRLDDALQGEQDARTHALCLGLTLEIFYLLSGARPRENAGSGCLPENAMRIQRYIGEHFAEIRSVSDVAAHFFYSREYVSRLFRQCFNTSPGDYLLKCRVAHSQSLISQGVSLSDACYQSGFGSMSTFIRAFRALTGRTPSQYRAESLE